MRLNVIFITGAAILALQLIASRIMTPYFGVSLYIWTSILSITLLFLALGYAIGGKYTHKKELSDVALWFHGASAFSALWVVISCMVYPMVFHALGLWDLILGSFVACLILLSGPLFLLSALNPLLVALARHQAEEEHKPTDSGSGHVFFISTLGSVAGVLVAAFLIIPFTTNYQALLWIAVALAAISMLSVWCEDQLEKPKKVIITGTALIALIVSGVLLNTSDKMVGYGGMSVAAQDNWRVLHNEPSTFGTIKVVQMEDRAAGVKPHRFMMQNGIFQNISLAANGKSISMYTYALEAMGLSLAEKTDRALVVGHGAGAVPRRFADRGIDVDVVEIDPKMYKVSREYFHFDDKGINTFSEDARTFVKRCDHKYDIVVLDIFLHTGGVPEHLVTQEFYEDVKECMTDGGAIALNLIWVETQQAPFYALLTTLNSTFGDIFSFSSVGDQGISNTFLAVRKDGQVETRLRDPVFWEEFSESVPMLQVDMLPAGFATEITQNVGDTGRIYTADSKEVKAGVILTDNANSWNQITLAAQMVHQKALLSVAVPALLLN